MSRRRHSETSQQQQSQRVLHFRSPREENGESHDAHNDTTVSEVSADITVDSVKDHIGGSVVMVAVETRTEETPGGSRSERVETVSRTVETTVVQTTSHVVPGVVTAADAANVVTTNGDVTE